VAQFRHGQGFSADTAHAGVVAVTPRRRSDQPPAAQRMAQRRSPGEHPHLLLGLAFFFGFEEVVLFELVLLLELDDFEEAALRLAARAQAAF
jgi:hypothetical protein